MTSRILILPLALGVLHGSCGCSGGLPPEAESALSQAKCAQALASRVSPDTTIREALAVARELRACFAPAPAPAPAAPAPDAGVK